MRRRLIVMLFGALCVMWPPVPASAQGPCQAADAPGCTHGLPTADYARLLSEMQAYPAPAVAPIPVDSRFVDRFTFWQVQPGASRYDAPNGSIIGAFGEGFRFVAITARRDGFARLRDGAWLRMADLTPFYASEFAGVRLTRPLKFPFGWVHQASIPAHYPGGPSLRTTPALKRYALVNVYATAQARGRVWYLVGPGQWLDQSRIGVVDLTRQPAGAPADDRRWVAVDVAQQTLVIHQGQTPLFATLVSTGQPDYQTNIGVFEVYQRLELTSLTGSMGGPGGYALPLVPYALFFDRDIGFHGVYWHDDFGVNRSHGCVNLSITDARFLFEWAGEKPLTVVIWDSRGRNQGLALRRPLSDFADRPPMHSGS